MCKKKAYWHHLFIRVGKELHSSGCDILLLMMGCLSVFSSCYVTKVEPKFLKDSPKVTNSSAIEKESALLFQKTDHYYVLGNSDVLFKISADGESLGMLSEISIHDQSTLKYIGFTESTLIQETDGVEIEVDIPIRYNLIQSMITPSKDPHVIEIISSGYVHKHPKILVTTVYKLAEGSQFLEIETTLTNYQEATAIFKKFRDSIKSELKNSTKREERSDGKCLFVGQFDEKCALGLSNFQSNLGCGNDASKHFIDEGPIVLKSKKSITLSRYLWVGKNGTGPGDALINEKNHLQSKSQDIQLLSGKLKSLHVFFRLFRGSIPIGIRVYPFSEKVQMESLPADITSFDATWAGATSEKYMVNDGKKIQVQLPRLGKISFEIRDEEGVATSAQIEVVGIDGTNTPLLGSENGIFIRGNNILHTISGIGQELLLPGKYRLKISKGKGYAPDQVEILVEEGKVTQFTSQLTRDIPLQK